jgi:hypothetical protein
MQGTREHGLKEKKHGGGERERSGSKIGRREEAEGMETQSQGAEEVEESRGSEEAHIRTRIRTRIPLTLEKVSPGREDRRKVPKE